MNSLLNINNISKSYINPLSNVKQKVLENTELNVLQQDTISITGPSGSGKSTLLNILGLLTNPDTGTYTFKGQNVSNFSNKQLSEFKNTNVGFIFQQHHLLAQLNVIENVLLPTLANKSKINKNEIKQRAEELLEKVELKDKIYSLPSQLSGGECQRVAVVRAFVNNPELVLADEPTGSLDNKSAKNVMELLMQINAEYGTSLITVTHSVEIAKMMNKHYSLTDGKLNLN